MGKTSSQRDLYESKNILVIGVAGFIASHVTTRLIKNYPNYKIVALDKINYSSTLKNLFLLGRTDGGEEEVNSSHESQGDVNSNREKEDGLLYKNTVAVIFAGKDVAVEDTCQGTCYLHGALAKQPYIAVGNPEKLCPGKCAVPFYRPDEHFGPPLALTLEPPSGNVGADAVIIHFASALAETVTNPFNSGFFGGEGGMYQAATACAGLFASNALPGFPGNVRVDPQTGGAFNGHDVNNTKFLLPVLWDVKTSSCWTSL